MKKKEKSMIGWYEHLDFPEWRIKKLKTKVDTGALTSSLHVENIKFHGVRKISFVVVQCTKDKTKRTRVESVNIARISKVKASPIHKERRIVVKTKMKLGEVEKEIEINLVDRSKMKFRMILGRTALKSEFVVDVSKSNMLGKK